MGKNMYSISQQEQAKLQAIRLVHTPSLPHKLAWWCGGLFMLLIISLFLPWTQNISSRGVINSFNPADRPQTIESTIAGRIEMWYVREGQAVKKGDTIVRLSEIKDKYFDPKLLPRMNDQINAKEGALAASRQKVNSLESQVKALQSGLEYSLSKANNKLKQSQLKVQSDSMDLTAAKIENKIASDQFDRQQKLYNQGLKSLTELEQRKLKLQETAAKLLSTENKYNASRNDLSNARIELFSLQAEYRDKIAKAEAEINSTMSYIYSNEADISKMRNEYSNVEIRNSFYYITSPRDGYVIKAQKEGLGETVKEGEAVVTIMAVNPDLAVELYVKPMDVALLKTGSSIRLQFDGWPALVFSGWPDVGFGTFGGKVAVIDNIDTDGKYRVLVVPDDTQEPWPAALRVGTGAAGWAMLNDVPLYYEIWRQMNGFPPDYTGAMSPVQKKKPNIEKQTEY
jgi:multidrug resistance efflux pump